MKTKINFALLSILFIFSILGCDSRFNEQVMYGTVGSKLEKIAPGEVKINSASTGNKIVELTWINPTDKDLYGVKITITATNSDAKIPDPIDFTAQTPEDIPTKYTFYELTNDVDYSFLFQSYDKNLNYSSGTGITAKPSKGSDIANVENAKAFSGNGLVELVWDNKDFATLHEIKITCREFDKKTNTQTSDVTTISLPKDPNTGKIPSSYTFYNLNNGKGYDFKIYQYDKELNQSSGVGVLGYPEVTANTNEVSLKDINNQDSSVILTWDNPNSENFYGIQIVASSNDGTANLGNLSSPVYFLKKETSEIPNSFTAIGLDNNKTYTFTVYTVDEYLTLSTGRSINGKPAPTSNNNEVQSFKAVPGNGYVDLFWKLPDNISLLEKYVLYVSPGRGEIFITDKSQTSYRATGLTNGTACTFTLRTIDISGNFSKGVVAEARPDTGSSGIFDNKDLVRYKNSCYAYDFGYCSEPTEKKFVFTSVTQMNLSNNPVTSIMGKNDVYSVISAQNITGDSYGQKTVNPGDEFEITIRYTPQAYNKNAESASWDEANIKIGNISENTIRVIGSNYPQPKSISKNELRMWLRSDMISQSDLTDEQKVKRFPDYSGNSFDANCFDKTYSVAPKYIESGKLFNEIPYIDFNNTSGKYSQLIANGAPIVEGKKGNTTFVVYKFGTKGDSGQGVICTNYGTAFPTVYASNRYYNDSGYYITGDYKYGISVKGYGLAGSNRWACISNNLNDDDNRMLVVNAPTTATGLSKKDRISSNVIGLCTIFDATIEPQPEETGRIAAYPNDYPSNIRMIINGQERLLAYFDTMSSTTHQLKTDSNALKGLCTEESSWLLKKVTNPSNPSSSDGITTYGIYGKPFGDGKGHRYGSLSDAPKPQNINSATYAAWKNAAETAGGIRENPVTIVTGNDEYKQQSYKRKFDTAFKYNSPAGFGATASSDTNSDGYNSFSNLFSNWIDKNSYRNGTITTLSIGADISNANYTEIQIAEVFVFEGALSEDDIEAMNNYIMYRYNLPIISDNPADYQ